MQALRNSLLACALAFGAACVGWAAPFAYVSNERSGTVSVVDTANDTVVATVRVGDVPYGIAAGPHGTRVYVANRRSNDVSVIDTATNAVVATVGVGDSPFGIAAHPAGIRVYVANAFSASLSVIDAATHRVDGIVDTDPRPRGVAVNPAGTRVYVASDASLGVVDTASNTLVARVPLGGEPYGVAVSPDGRQVYVGIRQVTTFNPIPPPPCITPPGGPPCPTYPIEIVNYRVLVLDAASNTFAAKIELDGTSFGVAVDPQSSTVYVTTPATGTLWVVDGRTATVVRKLAVGVAPYGVSVHPDGRRVYVADAYSNSVRVLDVATGQLVAEVGVEVSPIAFGAFVGPPADLPAVEYYHGTYGHYFVTAGADEIALLDSGAIAGWVRTGESFRVRPLRTPGAADVCRFWSGNTFAPKSSHFCTPFEWECVTVRGNPVWTYEGTRFAANLPDASGACAPGRIPLYRLYNDGMTGAPNHRFTTSTVIRSTMVAQGWRPEGSGALGVSACVQAP